MCYGFLLDFPTEVCITGAESRIGKKREDLPWIEEKFTALFSAFQFGAPPHAGIAPGVDRMLMILSNSKSIREVIAFPLSSKAEDLMMGAPGIVTTEQLRELHLRVSEL